MTRFENVGVFIRGEGLAGKQLSHKKGGRHGSGGSEYRINLWRITTQMEARGAYVKNIIVSPQPSHGSPRNAP